MHRLPIFLLFLSLSHCPAWAEELSAEQLAEGERYQRKQIAEAEELVSSLEEQKKFAAKNGQREIVKNLIGQLREAKRQLTALERYPIEHFARRVIDEKELAEKEKQRLASEREKAMAEEQAEALKDKEEQARQATRQKESGGCPLELTRVNFVHTSGKLSKVLAGEYGDKTVCSFNIVNHSDQPVEAYEIRCVLFNGFDDVVREGSFIGTVLEPGRHAKGLLSAVQQAVTAVKMTAYIERAKLANGEVWQRNPEHKHVSMSVENLEGGVESFGD